MKIYPIIITWLLFGGVAGAGKYNPQLDINDTAPAWQELPGVDGQQHALKDLVEAKAVVVVFTCNSCPYAVDHEDRLVALQRSYHDQGVAVVAVNVNDTPEDNLAAMRRRAEEKGFTFPYLFDQTAEIAEAYGALRTPEFFVLNQDRQVVYMGALDDSPDGSQVTVRYVEQALRAALQGDRPAITETPPVGCRIRRPRVRR